MPAMQFADNSHMSPATGSTGEKDERKILTTNRKALQINLDLARYGTFAEIGAGQEVVRWFFMVGGAAGTIAKSTSAYDMAISDAIYGPSKRYVSRDRLRSMLDCEHAINLDKLGQARGDTTAFFTFADTVSARNFRGTNECHGWMGVKYQAHPHAPDSQIIIHVRMLDKENNLQQDALGIVGVNLLYAAFYFRDKPHLLLKSLLDNLSTERVEIDMVEFSGNEFKHVDNRAVSLKLVQLGLTGAAMFGPSGDVLQPSEVLRKKPVLVERGSFRPVTKVNIDIIDCALKQFSEDLAVAPDGVIELMEINLRQLLVNDTLDLADFLARADLLGAAGKTVLISDYFEYYRLASYLARYTSEPIAVAMGVTSLLDLFKEEYYGGLDGGILEAFGKLFTKNMRIYVYPYRDPTSGVLQTADTVAVPDEQRNIFEHLVERGRIKAIRNFDESVLHIFSREVLQRIKDGDAIWETMVPQEIAAIIKANRLLGYRDEENAAPPV
jgi:hypothetical protein